jgi:ribosomal protein S14
MKKFIKKASPAPKPSKRIKKSCTSCGDYFTCYQQNNYDYCRNCAINGSRYAQNQCPECGDGSGIIKFPNQKPRLCKTCALTKPLTKQKINCFYGCSFIANIARIMEQHYRQKHYPKAKEVKRG